MRLRRSICNKKLSGVCGGIGEYFNIDPNMIRVYFLVCFCYFSVAFVLIYILASYIIPKQDIL